MKLKNIPLKRWLEFIFTFIIGLLTLLALCFPLQKGGTTLYGITYQYEENGFDLFDFNSICRPENLEWISIVVGVFCIIQLVVAICTMAIAILHFFSGKFGELSFYMLLVCLIFCTIYLVLGPVLNTVLLNDENGIWLDNLGYIQVDLNYISVYTLSYIPFILTMIISLIYWLIKKYVLPTIKPKTQSATVLNNPQIDAPRHDEPNRQLDKQIKQVDEQVLRGSETAEPIHKSTEQKDENTKTNSKDMVSQLKTYKELLDSGILTQEEFDKLKKEILENK